MSLRLNPRKLLLSKWTAVEVRDKEKHFIVTRLVEPADPSSPLREVEIEAVYSRRSRILPWRELCDPTRWRQGWR